MCGGKSFFFLFYVYGGVFFCVSVYHMHVVPKVASREHYIP